jgi:hypothetical protein
MSDANIAKHQDIIDTGRYEIENGRFASASSNVGSGLGNISQEHATRSKTHDPPRIQPDAPPSHLDKGFSEIAPPHSPTQESGNQKDAGSRIGKWLHKARSHPSDKGSTMNLRGDDKGEAKLKRRSKVPVE